MGKLPVPPWIRPAIGGLVVGIIALLYPHVLGVGYQATDLALKEALPLGLMLALLLAKLVATAVALGSGFAGGVFSPSLFLGAMAGGAFGAMALGLFPDYASAQGAYTVAGLGGVAAAVLGAPISTILIMFELTNNYELTVAVMIVAVLASMLTWRFAHRSFFIWQLERRGIDFGTAQEAALLLSVTVPKATSLGELRRLVAYQRPQALLVVDEA